MSLENLSHAGLIPHMTVRSQHMLKPWETNLMTLWQKFCQRPDLGSRQGHSALKVVPQHHSHNIHHECGTQCHSLVHQFSWWHSNGRI